MRYANLPRFFDPFVVRGEWGYRAEFRCVEGHSFEAPGYTRTHRQTWESPEEGVCYCPECGSSDYGETKGEPFAFTVFSRRTIPIHHHRQEAA